MTPSHQPSALTPGQFSTILTVGMNRTSTGERIRKPGILGWLRLVRVFHKVGQAGADHLRRWGLTPAQLDVLARVGATPDLTQQDLADNLLVTKGNVCQLLSRLELAGLIVRRQNGRANRLRLTDAGLRIYAEAVPAHEDLISSRLANLSPEEQHDLLRLLRKLDRALD
jgi:DNA-binding MarR family transcriptional regulator